jgi:hypothetical protein
MRTQYLHTVLQQQQQQQQQCPEYLAPVVSDAKPQQQQQDCFSSGHRPMQAESAQAGAAKAEAEPASPDLPDDVVQPRSQLSPPHTPNTEDKRQHAAAALLHPQQQLQPPQQLQPQQQDAQTLFCLTPELSADGEMADALPKASMQPPQPTSAVAAAAAVAAEQQAAAEAARQRQEEQSRLQQLLEQQVSQMVLVTKSARLCILYLLLAVEPTC